MSHIIYDFISELDIPAALEIEKAGMISEPLPDERTV